MASEPNQPGVTALLVPVKWKCTDSRQVPLTDCVVTFVAHDLQPLSVVESDAFQDLLYTAEPEFHMPSRKRLSYTLLPQSVCVK